jgi:hypothetical protein
MGKLHFYECSDSSGMRPGNGLVSLWGIHLKRTAWAGKQSNRNFSCGS